MADTNARNPTQTREEEVNRFKEAQEIFDKFIKTLLGVIAFRTTRMGEALFTTHPYVMMVIVLMIVLLYLLWMLGTMLTQRTGIFPTMALPRLMLVNGSLCSLLLLTIICSPIAWLTAILWVSFLAVTAYYFYQDLFELAARAISDTIKIWIDYKRIHSRRLPV
ncbi:hypothetical protein CR513_40210, partial [Mucuna pruriens]